MSDPEGPCETCKAVLNPILCKLPCLRWIITDSSLYREQTRPYQMFSQRWQTMDLVDISTWASSEVKTIRLSQIYLDAPYEVEVREFEPVEGDMLEEKWTSNGIIKVHKIPRYALADMKKAALVLQNFIQRSIGTYIEGTVGFSDQLIWQTYFFAFKHARDAKVRLYPWCRSNCLTWQIDRNRTGAHPQRLSVLGRLSKDQPPRAHTLRRQARRRLRQRSG